MSTRAGPSRRPTAPTTFDLLWGERPRLTRGPRTRLTRDRIVRAGIALADRDGLDALTMAGVAARLGVTAMAVYRHVRDKEQLVALMIDAALGDPPTLGGPGWRAALAAWARAERALFRTHPWLLATATRRTAVGPHWAAWLDRALEALEPARLSARERMAVVSLVDGHVRSAADLRSRRGNTGWGDRPVCGGARGRALGRPVSCACGGVRRRRVPRRRARRARCVRVRARARARRPRGLRADPRSADRC